MAATIVAASSSPLTIYGGFGWNFGYWGFDPFYYGYGSSAWLWGRNGFWYNPYGYYGYYGYDPYAYWPSYYSGSSYSASSSTSEKREMGSLRIKASPRVAKVYVDGTLMGTVDDFDGMRHHLELQPGAHRIELSADGYQTLSKDVTVATGTTTLRLTLKKK